MVHDVIFVCLVVLTGTYEFKRGFATGCFVFWSSNHLRLFLDITGQYKVYIRGERSSDRPSDVYVLYSLNGPRNMIFIGGAPRA